MKMRRRPLTVGLVPSAVRIFNGPGSGNCFKFRKLVGDRVPTSCEHTNSWLHSLDNPPFMPSALQQQFERRGMCQVYGTAM